MVQDDGSAGQSTSIFRDMTRATKFQKKFQLPPDFSEVLKDFTREVLRDQPGDIYAYAANYFKRVCWKPCQILSVVEARCNSSTFLSSGRWLLKPKDWKKFLHLRYACHKRIISQRTRFCPPLAC